MVVEFLRNRGHKARLNGGSIETGSNSKWNLLADKGPAEVYVFNRALVYEGDDGFVVGRRDDFRTIKGIVVVPTSAEDEDAAFRIAEDLADYLSRVSDNGSRVEFMPQEVFEMQGGYDGIAARHVKGYRGLQRWCRNHTEAAKLSEHLGIKLTADAKGYLRLQN